LNVGDSLASDEMVYDQLHRLSLIELQTLEFNARGRKNEAQRAQDRIKREIRRRCKGCGHREKNWRDLERGLCGLCAGGEDGAKNPGGA
jgi:hypothetical protein